MKLLTPQKRVNFHGIELLVPKDVKTLVADEDGNVYEYHTDAENGVTKVEFVCRVDLEGIDWRETKVSV